MSKSARGERNMRKAAAFMAAVLGLTVLSGASAQSVQPSLLPKPISAAAPKAQLIPAATSQGQGTASLSAQDVNSWLDGYMPISLGRADIPGAVVVVVKDGQILTSRGYGFADVAKRKPVDPHT